MYTTLQLADTAIVCTCHGHAPIMVMDGTHKDYFCKESLSPLTKHCYPNAMSGDWCTKKEYCEGKEK